MIAVLRLRGLTGSGVYKEVTGEKRAVKNASDKKSWSTYVDKYM